MTSARTLFQTKYPGEVGIVSISCSRQNGFVVTNTRLQDNPYALITKVRFNIAGIDVTSINLENVESEHDMHIKIDTLSCYDNVCNTEVPIACAADDLNESNVARATALFDQWYRLNDFHANVKLVKSDNYEYQVRYDIKNHILTLTIIQIVKIDRQDYTRMYGNEVKTSKSVEKKKQSTDNKRTVRTLNEYEAAAIDNLLKKYFF